jgi:hypothetical protein
MPIGHRGVSRSLAGAVLLIAAGASALAGCTAAAPPSIDPGARDPASGFPLGSFSKEVHDPVAGRLRLVWTFEPDGGYAEIPVALDGQTLDWPPIRGAWAADTDTVTIATTYPPGWGTSTHGWRLDRDELWTYLVESDNPEDVDWFTTLDTRPWLPLVR